MFAPEDVDSAIEMLQNAHATHLLELNPDLVDCCREARQYVSSRKGGEIIVHDNSNNGGGIQSKTSDSSKNNIAHAIRKKKLSRRMQSNGFKALKDLTVDFACREDLAITSLREFLEVFVQSVKRDQVFHQELLSS